MKRLMTIMLSVFAITIATSTFAAYESTMTRSTVSKTTMNKTPVNKTSFKQGWRCETNASRATTEDQKRADEMMSKKSASAMGAFGYAVKHCRDCTKITCTVESGRY